MRTKEGLAPRDLMRVQLRHFRYFLALAETLNFHKAAEKLFISQPSLSQQISQFEDIIGVQLVERSHKGIQLTDAGKLMQQRAQHLLDEVQGVLEDVVQHS